MAGSIGESLSITDVPLSLRKTSYLLIRLHFQTAMPRKSFVFKFFRKSVQKIVRPKNRQLPVGAGLVGRFHRGGGFEEGGELLDA
jgi:hypothetical protein